MAVAIEKEVDVVMVLHISLSVQHKILFIFAHVRRFFALSTFHTAMFSPIKPQSHAPTGVQSVEKHLAKAVVKHLPQQLKRVVGVAQPIAVRQVEHLTIYLRCKRFLVYNQSALLFQVAISPQVVVSHKEMHLNAHVRQFGQLA